MFSKFFSPFKPESTQSDEEKKPGKNDKKVYRIGVDRNPYGLVSKNPWTGGELPYVQPGDDKIYGIKVVDGRAYDPSAYSAGNWRSTCTREIDEKEAEALWKKQYS